MEQSGLSRVLKAKVAYCSSNFNFLIYFLLLVDELNQNVLSASFIMYLHYYSYGKKNFLSLVQIFNFSACIKYECSQSVPSVVSPLDPDPVSGAENCPSPGNTT